MKLFPLSVRNTADAARFSGWRRDSLGRDLLFFLTAIALPLFGLLVLHPASSLVSVRNYGASDYFVSRQLIWFFIGFILMVGASYVPLSFLRRSALPLLITMIFVLAAVFIPGLGDSVSSSKESFQRWLVIGPFRFQPSEFAKIALALYAAHWLSKGDVLRSEFYTAKILPPSVLILAVVILILLQPQYGTTIAITASLLIILYISGFPMLRLGIIIASLTPVIMAFGFLSRYRLDRFRVWLDPYSYRHEGGYQMVTAFRAFQEGGLTGNDLSQGFAHRYLTFGHTDFIFALLAEDYGWIGVQILLLLFLLYAFLAVYNLRKVRQPFPFILGSASLVMLSVQTLMNLSVVTGLMPVTGVSLPFISYGGSSLIASMIFSGLILNATRYASSEPEDADPA